MPNLQANPHQTKKNHIELFQALTQGEFAPGVATAFVVCSYGGAWVGGDEGGEAGWSLWS